MTNGISVHVDHLKLQPPEMMTEESAPVEHPLEKAERLARERGVVVGAQVEALEPERTGELNGTIQAITPEGIAVITHGTRDFFTHISNLKVAAPNT